MKRVGKSYAKRVADVNSIYNTYARTGLSNREIWRRYIYPRFAISERTFYSLLKAPTLHHLEDQKKLSLQGFLFPELFPEYEIRNPEYFKKHPQ